jgi:hypothetical protein
MGEGSVNMVIGADMGNLMNKMRPMMSGMMGAYPEEFGTSLMESMDAFEEIYGLFGGGMVASGGFTNEGMQMSAFFDGSHFDELLTAYRGTFELPFWEQLGMKYLDTKTGKSGDIEVTRFAFDFDLTTMMGMMGEEIPESELEEITTMIAALYGEQLVITFAKVNDIGVMVLGADDKLMTDALGRVATGGSVPENFEHIHELAANSNPFISYGLDLGELMTTLIPVLESSLGAPTMGMEMFEGLHLPMNFYFGASKTSWTSGMMVDLVQVSEFVQMIMMLEEM